MIEKNIGEEVNNEENSLLKCRHLDCLELQNGQIISSIVQYIITGAEKKYQLYIQDWKYVPGSRECEKDL